MAVFKETNKKKIPKKLGSLSECYYFRCYYIDIYGNKKRKQSQYFAKKKEAQEEERAFLNSIKMVASSKSINFKSLRESYLAYQKDKIRITSYDTLNHSLTYLESLDNIVVESFDYQQFLNWKERINKENLSTSYKNNIYKRFRSLLNYGSKICNLNVSVILNKFTNFTNPSELKKEMLFYTKEEFDKFIDWEKDLKWVCFFSTLFYCGLRQGEALALNWNDIDFENGTITISKSLANKVKGVKYLILPPKTKASNRTIPMPISLQNKLHQRYLEMQKYKNFDNCWFVFGDILPLPTTTIQKRRDKLVELSGVKRIRIHDFRHSCASLLISKGANITLVSKFLGHSNVATTLNIYTHFYKNDLALLVSTIDQDEENISYIIDNFLKNLLKKGYNTIEITRTIEESINQLNLKNAENSR